MLYSSPHDCSRESSGRRQVVGQVTGKSSSRLPFPNTTPPPPPVPVRPSTFSPYTTRPPTTCPSPLPLPAHGPCYQGRQGPEQPHALWSGQKWEDKQKEGAACGGKTQKEGSSSNPVQDWSRARAALPYTQTQDKGLLLSPLIK